MSRALQAPKASRKVRTIDADHVDLTDLPRRLVTIHEWRTEVYSWANGYVSKVTTEDILEARPGLIEDCDRARKDLLAGLNPASRAEIAKSLTILAGCFPNAENKDLSVYGQMAVIDVESTRLNRLQLQSAFTRLRRTKTFLPSIAEIMEAIRETTDSSFYLHSITDLQMALMDVEEQVVKIANDKAERRAQWLEDAIRRVSDGKSTGVIPRDIVEEAKRIVGIKEDEW